MASTWNKKERENKKQQNKKEKEERKQERKENSKKGKSLDDMMAYLDEYGNITSTPPDPKRRVEVKLEDIEIGVPKQRPIDPSELIRKGIITFFNDEKGYGFIKDQVTQESIFVHINASPDHLKQNSKVSFEVEKGPRGLNAVNVKIIG